MPKGRGGGTWQKPETLVIRGLMLFSFCCLNLGSHKSSIFSFPLTSCYYIQKNHRHQIITYELHFDLIILIWQEPIYCRWLSPDFKMDESLHCERFVTPTLSCRKWWRIAYTCKLYKCKMGFQFPQFLS